MIDYTTLSEFELADRLRAGDETAFSTIYKKYWDKLLAVAGRRLNNVAEAEEAVQDIFLNLWKRKEGFKLQVSFENYFAVAVKFEIINRLAKRSRESNRDNVFATNLNNNQVETYENFDLNVLEKQLQYNINLLPPKCQLVFRMSREEQLANKRIGKELNISEKAVEKHITFALKTLRTKLGHYLTVLMFFI